MPGVLVLGYGNPARGDDGLGPLVAERIEALGLPGVEVETGYQLDVEDAAAVAEHDAVVFVDAAAEGPEPFSWGAVEPQSAPPFSTHSLAAGHVLGLARELFGSRAEAFLLGVRGYSFQMFCEEITAAGKRNAEAAVAYLAARSGAGVVALCAERGRP